MEKVGVEADPARRTLLWGLVVLVPLILWPAAHLNVDVKHFVVRAGTAVLALLLVLGAARSGVLHIPFLPIPILAATAWLHTLGIGLARPRTDWVMVEDAGTILFFFLCALSLTRNGDFVRKLLSIWVGTSAVVCAYYLLQVAGIDPVKGFNPGHNVFGSCFGNRNFMSFYLVVTFPFALYLALGAPHAARVMYFLAAALIASVIAVSNSRAGLGILLLSLPAYLWYFMRHRGAGRTAAVLRVLLVLSLAVAAAAIAWAAFRFASSDSAGRDWLFHGRLGIWRDTLRLIADHPWLGHGPGTFPRVFPDFRSTELGYFFGFYEPVFSSHNVLLDMVAETGALGAFLFLALVAAGSGLLAVHKDVLAQNKDRAFFSGMALLGCGLFSLTGEIHHVMFCTLFSWLSLAIFHNSVSARYREWRIPVSPNVRLLFACLVVGPLAPAAVVSAGGYLAASLEIKRARDLIHTGSNPFLAAKPLEQALRLEPGNLFAQYQLGYLEMWRGRPREALERYLAIEKVHPHFESLSYNMGLARLELGEHRMALESFSSILRIYPTFEPAMEGMSRAYQALGMTDSARVWAGRRTLRR